MKSGTYKASNGTQFNWALVSLGDIYGHKMQLVNDSGKALVEIYDSTTSQMISRYYLRTLMRGYSGIDSGKGICLEGGVPQWEIDAVTWQAMLSDIVTTAGESS